MKNFLIYCMLAIGLIMTTAPVQVNAQSPVTPSKVTVNNTDTSYLTLKVIPYFDAMTVQVIVTKSSGTVNGYIIPQYSNDGVNYVESTDSLLVTNKPVNSKLWEYPKNKALYYRYRYIASGGTQAATITGRYVLWTRPIK